MSIESPMLDTSDGLEFLGESKGTKEMELVSSQAKDMSQSQVEFSEDIMNLVVEDSDIDEDCSIWGKSKRKGSSIFREPKRKEETTTTCEAELTSLRNRVQYLENEAKDTVDVEKDIGIAGVSKNLEKEFANVIDGKSAIDFIDTLPNNIIGLNGDIILRNCCEKHVELFFGHIIYT